MNAHEGVVIGPVRVWLRLEGLAVLALSLYFYEQLGMRWWIFAALLLVPDLAMLGYLVNQRFGAAAYNVVHSYTLPLVLAMIALATQNRQVLPLLCIWTAHIGMDRCLGFGLKYATGFGDSHLGSFGKVSG
jgi:Domain of unknown function (DUF4260)